MRFYLVSTVLAMLLCIANHPVHSAPSECSSFELALEDEGIAQAMTALSDKYKLETTPEEHSKRCKEVDEALDTLRNYNRECYPFLAKQTLRWFLKNRAETNEARCKSPKSQEFTEAVEAAKCLAVNATRQIREAEKKILLLFQVLSEINSGDSKQRARRACCAVLDAEKMFMDATKPKCSEHRRVYDEYVSSFTDEALGISCPLSKELDCESLEKVEIEGVTPKSKFYLSPFVKMLKSMEAQS